MEKVIGMERRQLCWQRGGLEKVDAEWHLIAATHNLLKLFRYRRSKEQALATG